jgi:hypothetical protein
MLRVLLETSEASARGFAVAGSATILRVTELELADRALGIDVASLSNGLRKHLIDQSRAQCGDAAAAPGLVDAFNALRLRTGDDPGVRPLSAADVRPARILGRARIDALWQTPDARRLHGEFLDLRGRGAQPIPFRQRLGREWLTQAELHLVHVDQWSGLGEPAAVDYFFEKGALYIGLIDLAPRGALRAHVFRSFAEFLRHAEGAVRPQLWFAIANRLIELTHSEDEREVLPILERSGDRVLALYAHVARVAASGRETTAQ